MAERTHPRSWTTMRSRTAANFMGSSVPNAVSVPKLIDSDAVHPVRRESRHGEGRDLLLLTSQLDLGNGHRVVQKQAAEIRPSPLFEESGIG